MAIKSRVKRSLLPTQIREAFELKTSLFGMAILTIYLYQIGPSLLSSDWMSLKLVSYLVPVAVFIYSCIRLYQGLQVWFKRVRLYGKNIIKMDHDELLKKITARPGYIYLGEGFEVTPEHTQAHYEMSKVDEAEIKPPKLAFWLYELFYREKIVFADNPEDREKGKGWIHGVGAEKQKSIYVPVSDLQDHLGIPGTTGSGKSQTYYLMITGDIHRKPKEVVIAIDPKSANEFWRRMYYECISAGRPDDFLFFSLAHPSFSIGINPLHNYSSATDCAERMFAVVANGSPQDRDSFQAFLWEKIVDVVNGFEIIGVRPTINNVMTVIETNPEKLLLDVIIAFCEQESIPAWRTSFDSYKRQVENDDDGFYARPSFRTPNEVVAAVLMYEEHVKHISNNPAINSLIEYYGHDRNHFQRMIAGVKPYFKPLRSGDIGKLINPDLDDNPNRPWWDMAKIAQSDKVLYIGTNAAGNPQVSTAVAAMLIADTTELMAGRSTYEHGGNSPVNISVDESAALLVPAFIEQLNKGRSVGFRIRLATQVLNDFVVRLGSEAARDQVLGNVNQVLSLAVRDKESKEYISELTGPAVILTTQTSQSTGAMGGDKDVFSFSGSYGERTTETEAQKIPPSILQDLPNLEYIGVISRSRVVKGKIPVMNAPKEGWPKLEDIPWVKHSRAAA